MTLHFITTRKCFFSFYVLKTKYITWFNNYILKTASLRLPWYFCALERSCIFSRPVLNLHSVSVHGHWTDIVIPPEASHRGWGSGVVFSALDLAINITRLTFDTRPLCATGDSPAGYLHQFPCK